MVLKINGIDLLTLQSQLKIAFDGLSFEHSDLDGEETGRAENGVLHRVKLAEVHTITIKFTPMQPEELDDLLQECRKKYVTITFSDPFQRLQTTTAEFYNSSRNVKIRRINSDGAARYDDVTLKFIGRGVPLGEDDNW